MALVTDIEKAIREFEQFKAIYNPENKIDWKHFDNALNLLKKQKSSETMGIQPGMRNCENYFYANDPKHECLIKELAKEEGLLHETWHCSDWSSKKPGK